MPVDPPTLEWANWWYDISGKWLLIMGGLTAVAASITVALAFAQWRSNNIIEAHNEWRTATLEAEGLDIAKPIAAPDANPDAIHIIIGKKP